MSSEYREEDIIVRPHPWLWDHDVTLDPVFVILGMFDEYRGCQWLIEGEAISVLLSDEFFIHLESQGDSLVSGNQARREQPLEVRKASFLDAIKQEIEALFNVDYEKREGSFTSHDKVTRRLVTIRSHRELFEFEATQIQKVDRKLSYILGVYERYGNEDRISFPNASHKASLIRDLLIELWCPHVTWTTHAQGAPHCNSIQFELTPPLRKLFGLPQVEFEPTSLDT